VPISAQDFSTDIIDLVRRIEDLRRLANATSDPEAWIGLKASIDGLLTHLRTLRDQVRDAIAEHEANVAAWYTAINSGLLVDLVAYELAIRNAEASVAELGQLLLVLPVVELLGPPPEHLPPPPVLAVPEPIPEDPWGIGDLFDPALWTELFSNLASLSWSVTVDLPALLQSNREATSFWGGALELGIFNVPAKVAEELLPDLWDPVEWLKGETEDMLAAHIGGAESILGDILSPWGDLFSVDGILDLLGQATSTVATFVSSGLTLFLEGLEGAAALLMGPMLREMRPHLDRLPVFVRDLFDLEDPRGEWQILALAGITGAVSGAIGGPLVHGFMAPWVWEQNAYWQPRLLGQDTLAIMEYREPRFHDRWLLEANRLGISTERWDSIVRAAAKPLYPQDIKTAYYRVGMTDEELDDLLGDSLYGPKEAEYLKATFPEIPEVQDVVRFAVREVYRDDIVREYGLDQDFGFVPLEEYARLGVATEDMAKWWRAHWVLPSIGQTFEMFHRTTTAPIGGFSEPVTLLDGTVVYSIISLDRVLELLRVQDVMPNWRDPLTRIAYQPVTRVDIRRLFRTGTVDLATVQRAYLDLGYSPEHALLMADFVENLEREQTFNELETILSGRAADGTISIEAALAELFAVAVPERVQFEAQRRIEARVERAQIQDIVSAWRQALRAERVGPDAFTAALVELELPAAQVEHLLSFEMVRRGVDQLVFEEPEIRASGRAAPMRRFREGLSTAVDLTEALEVLGYQGDQLARLETIATIERSTALVLDTLAAYRAGLRTGRLDEPQFRSRVASLGIQPDFIDLYVEYDQLRRKLEDPPEEEKELRAAGRGTILARYREGWIGENQFALEMGMLGYTDAEISRYGLLAKLTYDYDWRQDILGQRGEQFVRGEISGEQYLVRVVALGMTEDRAKTHLAKLQATLLPRIRIVPAIAPLPRYKTAAGKVQVLLAREEFRAQVLDLMELEDRLAVLEMPADLVDAIVGLEEFQLQRRIALKEKPAPPLYETDVGELRIRELREAFRAADISSTQLQVGLAELEMPADLVDAFVDFEVTRLAIRRREKPVEPVPAYKTAAGRDAIRLQLERFAAGAIAAAELRVQFRELEMPAELVEAKADLAAFRLAVRAAAPEVPEIPMWETDEGKIRMRTVREAYRQLLIDAEEHHQLLRDLEVPENIAAALTEFEVVRAA